MLKKGVSRWWTAYPTRGAQGARLGPKVLGWATDEYVMPKAPQSEAAGREFVCGRLRRQGWCPKRHDLNP